MQDGIIQDQNGDYYVLDMSHQGTYGKLISSNGYTFNGATFQFDQSHSNGTFGKVLNPEVITASGLPITQVNTAGKPIYYTANFNSYGGGNSGGSGSSGSGYNAGNTLGGNSGGSVQQQSVSTSDFSFDKDFMNAEWGGLDSSFFDNLGHDFSYYYENSVFG